MTKKRYAIYPGRVLSRSDGSEHFISAAELIRLYGVRESECVVMPSRAVTVRGLVKLFPRWGGDYTLPEG